MTASSESPKKIVYGPRRATKKPVILIGIILVLLALSIAIFDGTIGDFGNRGTLPEAGPRWMIPYWGTIGLIVKITGMLATFFILIAVAYRYEWSGFATKTVWDWLGLLIVPVVIAAGGFWFTLQQQDRQEKVEAQRAQDGALQGYLEEMGNLLLEEDLLESRSTDNVRSVARARTLTILGSFNENHSVTEAREYGEKGGLWRKGSVVQFLKESELIEKPTPVLSLQDADLANATIVGVNLRNTKLTGATLTEADLSHADLTDADLGRTSADDSSTSLSKADLESADLKNANLRHVFLSDANLTKADLSGADLRESDLKGANFTKANLSGADLSGARITEFEDVDFTEADLSNAKVNETYLERCETLCASLKGATMPDGSKHD